MALVDRCWTTMQDKAASAPGTRRCDLIDGFRRGDPGGGDRQPAGLSAGRAGAPARLVAGHPGALEPSPTPAMHEAGNRAVVEFMDYLRMLVADRRAHPLDPEEDVLTRLLQPAADGDELTERQLLHNCIFLLNAGHETTTNLIGNGVHALLAMPGQLRAPGAVAATVCRRAIEEMLRYQSPLQLNNRRLLEPCADRRHESSRPARWSRCASAPPTATRRSSPSPTGSTSRRKPNRHLAFGHGEHACAGMNVARMEARIAVARAAGPFPRASRSAARRCAIVASAFAASRACRLLCRPRIARCNALLPAARQAPER